MEKAGKDFEALAFMLQFEEGRKIQRYRKDQVVFSQGTAADAVFYIQKGKVKLAVLSERGREAVVAILSTGDFLGEGCLAGKLVRMETARAFADSSIVRLEKGAMVRALRDSVEFAELFIAHLVSRNIRVEEDLLDHLFNSSEKRLARVLLLLANFGKETPPEPTIPKITQETLAEMVGTTRSRVSFFLNRFRKRGFIEYNGVIRVNSQLLHAVLRD
jgi:CRP/FNR family transcriptional regulator, cyclic AMP receptor protein